MTTAAGSFPRSSLLPNARLPAASIASAILNVLAVIGKGLKSIVNSSWAQYRLRLQPGAALAATGRVGVSSAGPCA